MARPLTGVKAVPEPASLSALPPTFTMPKATAATAAATESRTYSLSTPLGKNFNRVPESCQRSMPTSTARAVA